MRKSDTRWFALKNYERLRKMTFLELYGQLSIRKDIYQVMFYSHNNTKSPRERLDDSGLENWIERIRNESIVGYTFDENACVDTVKNLTLESIQALLYDSKIFGDAPEYIYDQSTLSKPIDELVYENWGDTHDVGFRHLAIDIFAADEQIIEDFSNWLSNIRHKYNRYSIKKVFTERDKKSWINNRLIQFIDLKLITAYDDMCLTDHEMGDVLLSDIEGINREARTRRTIRSKAEYLMKKETMNTLALQLGIAPEV